MTFDPVVELAENANTYVPLVPGSDRVTTDRYVIWFGRGLEPGWTVAQRFRFEADELDEVTNEIHEHVRAHGRTACSWEVGSSARPADLVELLHRRGVHDDPHDPLQIGMALTGAPTGPPPVGIEVRRVASDDDELVNARIAAIAFGEMEVVAKPYDPDSPVVSYLAFIDGEPVGRATGTFSEYGVTLFGGATLPEWRGRGVYKALVHARLRDAAERGSPVAVTQAGQMSRPILEKLGFREVCRIRVLIDEFGR
jgi:GNAT superfamily N-acetyltransferase